MTPLVLLHPFPMDAGFWDGLRSILVVDRPVLAPSFPGFGGTAEAHPASIDGFADSVADLIAAQEGGRAVVCGLSMGGYSALSLVARHPGRVAGLILADTRAEADDDAARAARDQAVALVRAQGSGAFLNGFLPRLLAPDADTEVVQRARSIAERQPGDAIVTALTALRERADRTADLASVAAPTMVVVGSEDGVTPFSAAQVLATGIPGARLEVILGAGHLSALERPEEFARLVRSHLRTADL